jgi:Neuraminidase (sialidase)
LTWVVRIPTLVLTSTQQALYKESHLLRPSPLIFYHRTRIDTNGVTDRENRRNSGMTTKKERKHWSEVSVSDEP